MAPLGTWVLGILFVGVLAWAAWSINWLLDILQERAHQRRITDPTPIFRRDRALEALGRIYEEEDSAEMTMMLDRALEREGRTVSFTRGEDGVLREDDDESYIIRSTDGVVDRDGDA